MRNIKEILRLSWGLGLGKRQVARSCSISHSTVIECLRRAEKAALRWPLPDGLDEAALEALLYPRPDKTYQRVRRYIPFEYIHKELRRKGVTLQLLWDDYKEANLDGYQYSQFCNLYRQWEGKLDVTLRQLRVSPLSGQKRGLFKVHFVPALNDFIVSTILSKNRSSDSLYIQRALSSSCSYLYAITAFCADGNP